MKDSPISDLFNKSGEEQSALNKLLEKIPGFGGYLERGRRREADRQLRATIAARLEETRLQLGSVHQALSRDIIKAMDYAEPLGEADTRLMGLAGKVRDAAEGYAGFFDANKVDEDDLARVYAFDESMLEHAEEIAGRVSALEEAVDSNGDIAGTLSALNKAAREAGNTFSSRSEVLAGIV